MKNLNASGVRLTEEQYKEQTKKEYEASLKYEEAVEKLAENIWNDDDMSRDMKINTYGVIISSISYKLRASGGIRDGANAPIPNWRNCPSCKRRYYGESD
jgi:hypothetical protein